jgi:hypothetical protein
MQKTWFVRIKGRVHGPKTAAELRQLALAGKIGRDAEVGGSEAGPWHRADRVRGLFPQPAEAAGAAMPPPLPPVAVTTSAPVPTAARAAGNVAPAAAASPERRAYSHSGAVPPAGALAAIAAGIVAALVFALVYTMFIVWVPYIYVNVIATACFGGVVGLCVGWASKLGHVRNPLFVTLVAVACAAVGIYAEWGYTPSILIDSSIGLAGFSPGSVLTVMGALYEQGSWSMFGAQVKGLMLVLVWIVEWIVIVFCSVVGSHAPTGKQPYCEACRAWTITRKGVNHVAVPRDKAVTERVIGGDLRPLGSLTKATAATPSHWRLDVASCPRCPQSHFLIVNEVTITVNDKEEQKENAEEVGPILRLAPAELEFVTACGLPTPQAAAWQDIEDAMSQNAAD